MFSKLAASFRRAKPTLAAPLSIAARLTLWETLSAFLLLCVAATLLYLTLESSLQWDEDQFLWGRMQVFVPMLAEMTESSTAVRNEIAKEITRESGNDEYRGFKVRILSGEGDLLGESPCMAATLPSRLFPRPVSDAAAGTKSFYLTSTPGHPFRAATISVPAQNGNGDWVIQMGYDWS